MKKFLEALNDTWFVKVQQKTIRGVPDYVLCINGTFVALELKRSRKEKMEGTLQELNINKINKSGGLGLYAYPENWKHVGEILLGISKEGYSDKTKTGD